MIEVNTEIQTETTVTTRRLDSPANKKLATLLNELYRKIWTEACYDPDTEQSRAFAKTLLKPIQDLNKILKFKQ